MTEKGTLYLVATPIGNLEDMTFRAIRILKEADYIACEDTRHTLKLLNHFEIHKRLESYHEHNKMEKGPQIIEDILNGKNVALVTDAGTPAISDPGEDLVRLCHQHGVEVTSAPGPAALITGLILSGQDTRRFAFEGFLPHGKKERREILELLKKESRTVILYEAPHKLKGTLKDLSDALGDRPLTLTRELTKKFEEKLVMTLESAMDYYETNEPRGEYVLIIKGYGLEQLSQEKQQGWLDMSLEDHMAHYTGQDMSEKDAIKQIAKDRNVGKREIYQYFNAD